MRAKPSTGRAGLAPAPSREVLGVALVFAASVGALVVLSGVVLSLLSGVRAYVGGEALYSKSQKDAVQHLLRFGAEGDPAQYAAFEAAIAVPLADGRARRELLRPDADLSAAGRALVDGGNHPDDVAEMARLFRRARWLPEMREAIAIWAEGDARVEQLAALGARLREARAVPVPDAARIGALIGELERVNAELTGLEARFSATLGAGARRISRWATRAIAGVGLAVAGLGIATSLCAAAAAAPQRGAASARWSSRARTRSTCSTATAASSTTARACRRCSATRPSRAPTRSRCCTRRTVEPARAALAQTFAGGAPDRAARPARAPCRRELADPRGRRRRGSGTSAGRRPWWSTRATSPSGGPSSGASPRRSASRASAASRAASPMTSTTC